MGMDCLDKEGTGDFKVFQDPQCQTLNGKFSSKLSQIGELYLNFNKSNS